MGCTPPMRINPIRICDYPNESERTPLYRTRMTNEIRDHPCESERTPLYRTRK